MSQKPIDRSEIVISLKVRNRKIREAECRALQERAIVAVTGKGEVKSDE